MLGYVALRWATTCPAESCISSGLEVEVGVDAVKELQVFLTEVTP